MKKRQITNFFFSTFVDKQTKRKSSDANSKNSNAEVNSEDVNSENKPPKKRRGNPGGPRGPYKTKNSELADRERLLYPNFTTQRCTDANTCF